MDETVILHSMKIEHITQQSQLEGLFNHLKDEPWIALDTEFLRETTYYPKLCLIQVASEDYAATIDPLAIHDLSLFYQLLYNPEITKVLHASRQDLEIFLHLQGDLPPSIFDTQVAVPLLGLPEQMGYAKMIQERLNVSLEKSHTRADWSRRPLSEGELKYALDDVIYLARCYPDLVNDLKQKQRLGWLDDEFRRLSEKDLYLAPPEKAWMRIKAARFLKGRQLAILQQLALWRESTAQSDNLARGRLLKDDALIDIAKMTPKDESDLKRIRSLHPKTLQRFSNVILNQISLGSQKEPTPIPAEMMSEKLSPEKESIALFLESIVRIRAQENSLAAAQLASTKEIKQFILHPDRSSLMQGWRRQLIGEELTKLIQGDCGLKIINGNLEIYP